MIELTITSNDSSGGLLSPVDRLTHYFLEVRGELLRFFARRTDRARAEDLVQDVWLRLRERGNPDAWIEPRAVIFTVAAHSALYTRPCAAAAADTSTPFNFLSYRIASKGHVLASGPSRE